METKWLEDFISLAETRSFSRSAELRHVTQPAFSRRIQSLEAWLGVDLIDRSIYPACLSEAGEIFYEQATEMLGLINSVRTLIRGKRMTEQNTIGFAAPHALSLCFMPRFLTQVQAGFGALNTQLQSLNVHDAVQSLKDGESDLLLCYYHPRQPIPLDPRRYDALVLGGETMRPYVRCDKSGRPDLLLPGTSAAPIPYLAYTSHAYLGRIVDLIFTEAKKNPYLEKRYETAMAEGLKMMALEGHGLAFLPDSSVAREIKQRKLAPADNGQAEWAIDLDIRLYREKPSSQRPGKPVADKLWDYLQRKMKESSSSRLRRRSAPGKAKV